MRVHATTAVRPAPMRPLTRAPRRGVADSRALLLSIASGLLLAFYVHDPAGFQATIQQSRSTIQEVGSWFTPTQFQAALLGLTATN